MKVYLVIEDWVTDYLGGNYIMVCNNLEKAKKQFEIKVKDYKNTNGCMEIVNENETSFETYNEGYYTENHTHIYIEEKEVL